MKINDTDLDNYIKSFMGFGNCNAPIWFIGKEEAGSAKDIAARVAAWLELKKPNIADNYEFHSKFAVNLKKPKCFDYLFRGKNANLQPTWNGLIKLQLAIEKGTLASEETLKEFQSHKLGRKNSNNAILELFPLPSPDHNSHNYSEVSNLSYLETKKAYKEKIAEQRIKYLKKLIFDKKPKFVIFYATSKEFITYWKKIVDLSTSKEDKIKITGRDKRNRYLFLKKIDGITFCITQHPTYSGTSDNELLESGIKIRKFSEEKTN